MHKVFVSLRAEKHFKSLSPEVQKRIRKKLLAIGKNPKHYLDFIKELGAYKLRVGDYRVFVSLDDKQKRINVAAILHRSVAYQ